MLHLNVGHRLRDNLFEALRSSHRIKVRAHILNADEEPVAHMSWKYGSTRIVSGSVQVDTTQDVDRSLAITFADPRRTIVFDPDSPAEGASWVGYMIAVEYSVLVPHHNLFPRSDLYPSPSLHPGDTPLSESGTWVHCPVFQGPITHYSSSGGMVELEGQGKESLALAPYYAGKGYTLDKGLHVDNAIRRVLERIGETKFALPDLPWKLKHHRAVHPQSEPWRVVALGEEDAGGHRAGPLVKRTGRHPHHLFYDGRGKVRIKRLNKNACHTFDWRWLLSEPEVDYEGLEFINRVVVRGVKPKGKGKHRISAEVVLPKENPLSAHNLARAGKTEVWRTHYEDTDLDTEEKCRDRGRHILDHQSVIGLEASFECLPLPMLEPLDVVRVKSETLHVEFPVRQFTLPLTSSDPMTIGETKRVKTHPRVNTASHGAAGPGGGHGHGAAQGGSSGRRRGGGRHHRGHRGRQGHRNR